MALQPLPLADGIRVQRLGFGTWAWGNKLLWGYDTDDDPQLQAAFNAAVRQQNPFDNSRAVSLRFFAAIVPALPPAA